MRKNNKLWIDSKNGFQFFKYGKFALLIQWDKNKDKPTLNKILNLESTVKKANLTGLLELVPAYHSLTLYFNPRLTSHDTLIEWIEKNSTAKKQKSIKGKKITVPVTYDTNGIFDLEYLSSELNLSVSEIIALHSKQIYDVHFLGFLPGFIYLGGLHEKLNVPRKKNPRIRVPAGSVAIAAGQTGIYPIESPGGWHIIGHTNHILFDPTEDPPSTIQPGMRIQFKPIDL